MRERFRYSSLKVNDAFFGFWPLSRTDDRVAMDLFSTTAESATKIQATLRGLKERTKMAKMKEIYFATKKATMIAAIWRGRAARKYVKNHKYEIWLRKNAVTTLQCFFRCYLARNTVQRMREKRWMVVAPYAATKIQKVFRGTKGREVAIKAKIDHLNYVQRQSQCSVKLQSIVRRNLAMSLKKRLQTEKIVQQQRKISSCIKIQTVVRMKTAALTLNRLRMEHLSLIKREYDSACRIISFFRTLQFRINIAKRVEYTVKLNSMATVIQLWYRYIRKIILEKVEEKKRYELLRQRSAIVIEKNWRKTLAVMTLKVLKQKRSDHEALKCKKASMLTSWSRVCLARKLLGNLRSQHLEYLKLRFQVETEAATQIAACWRGYQGRLKARLALIAKKSRWKKMWSDEDGRYFFYNQVSS